VESVAAVTHRAEHGQDVLDGHVALDVVDRIEDEPAAVVENLDPLADLAVDVLRRAEGQCTLGVDRPVEAQFPTVFFCGLLYLFFISNPVLPG